MSIFNPLKIVDNKLVRKAKETRLPVTKATFGTILNEACNTAMTEEAIKQGFQKNLYAPDYS